MPRPNPEAAWQLGKVWRFGGPCDSLTLILTDIDFCSGQGGPAPPNGTWTLNKVTDTFYQLGNPTTFNHFVFNVTLNIPPGHFFVDVGWRNAPFSGPNYFENGGARPGPINNALPACSAHSGNAGTGGTAEIVI